MATTPTGAVLGDASAVTYGSLTAAIAFHQLTTQRLADLTALASKAAAARCYLEVEGAQAMPVVIPTAAATAILEALIADTSRELERLTRALNAAIRALTP